MSEPPKSFIQADDTIHETNPWTHNEWLCRPDIANLTKLLMVKATMPSKHCHPFHNHPHREEIIHVVKGRAEQWVGTEYRILEPGEVAIIPSGVPHATYNPFDEELIFHAILSPALLEASKSAAKDPCDVSDQEPWKSIRTGMTPCRLLGDP